MSKTELRKIARQIIKTNLVIWKAIHAVEDFHSDKIHLMSDKDLEELAKIMATYKNGTEQMAEPYLYGLYFQDFEEFGNRLQEYLHKYED